MIFHLDACIYNEEYQEALEKLARLCKERRLTSFVLDLSRNMGGNSAVIDEFIKYIDTDYFKRYEMTDYPELFTVQQHQPLKPAQLLHFN